MIIRNVIFITLSTACFAGIIYGPYLTWPSTDGAVVQYGRDIWDSAEICWADSSTYVATGTLPNSADIWEMDARSSYHITGYPPETRIYYQVAAGSDMSDIYSFRTMPIPGSPVEFAIYGDTRTGVEKHTEICEAMVEYGFDFVLHTGDLGDAAWDVDDWNMYFEAVDTIATKTPFITTIGNHEIPYMIYKYLFDLPGNEEWYSMHIGCVSFVVINVYNNYFPGSEQYEWLVATLTDSIPMTSLYTIILEHESPYSTSNHGGNPLVLEYLKPLYDSLGVDVVAAGHDHCYEHSYVNGVHYFVAGGAGAPLYSVDGGPYTVYMESAYHYIQAVADSDDLCFYTWRDDGVLMETFCLKDFPVIVREIQEQQDFTICANPNPFNSSVTLRISFPSQEIDEQWIKDIKLGVYNISGRLVDVIPVGTGFATVSTDGSENKTSDAPRPLQMRKNGVRNVGQNSPHSNVGIMFTWSPDESIGSGVYLVRAQFDEQTISQKLILIK